MLHGYHDWDKLQYICEWMEWSDGSMPSSVSKKNFFSLQMNVKGSLLILNDKRKKRHLHFKNQQINKFFFSKDNLRVQIRKRRKLYSWNAFQTSKRIKTFFPKAVDCVSKFNILFIQNSFPLIPFGNATQNDDRLLRSLTFFFFQILFYVNQIALYSKVEYLSGVTHPR